MTDSDITTTILRQIRDEIVATRTELKAELTTTRKELKAEIAATNERIDTTNARLDTSNERLSVVETVVRDAAQQIRTVATYVKNTHGAAIDELRKRVTRLEKKVG